MVIIALWLSGYRLRRLGNRFVVVDHHGFIVSGGASATSAIERWRHWRG